MYVKSILRKKKIALDYYVLPTLSFFYYAMNQKGSYDDERV